MDNQDLFEVQLVNKYAAGAGWEERSRGPVTHTQPQNADDVTGLEMGAPAQGGPRGTTKSDSAQVV